MLGILPPEIAKLIHVYVFEDVLKELLKKTKDLWYNINSNLVYKYIEHGDIHIFRDGLYGIIYTSSNGILYSRIRKFNKNKLLKEKLNFLKKHNRETIVRCNCGKIDSIIKYNEEDFLDDDRIIRCIHKEKTEKK